MTITKQQAAKQPAGGGCGRPALIGTMPPVSAVAGRSFAMAALSTILVTVFVPLCGLIWHLKSSNLSSSTQRRKAQSSACIARKSEYRRKAVA